MEGWCGLMARVVIYRRGTALELTGRDVILSTTTGTPALNYGVDFVRDWALYTLLET